MKSRAMMTQRGWACSVFWSLARRLAVEWSSAAVMMALRGFLTALSFSGL